MKRMMSAVLGLALLLSFVPTGVFRVGALTAVVDETVSTAVGERQAEAASLGRSDNTLIFKNVPLRLKGTTVMFADFGEMADEENKKIFPKFSMDTGIHVKTAQYLKEEYVSRVSQQIAAGKAPDVVVCSDSFPSALDITQPLPRYFDVNDGFWDKRVSEATKHDGKYYFVNSVRSPFTGGTLVYYNKALFAAAGVKTPEQYYAEGQWTYENLMKAARSLSNLGYVGAAFDPLLVAQQMGSSMIEYDSGVGAFRQSDGTAVVRALQYYAQGAECGAFFYSSSSKFVNGKMGMTLAGTYGMKYNGSFSDMPPSYIGVAPLPTSLDGKAMNKMPAGYRGYGVCRGASNSEGAYYLLRYILDVDKYASAGATIFGSATMEEYYREQLERFGDSDLYVDFSLTLLDMVGKGWDTCYWGGVRSASSNRVVAEYAMMNTVLDSTVRIANSLYSTYSGWATENGRWVYYENGMRVTNQWKKDSVGWCYLGADGYMKTNDWARDSVGWCYLGKNGYCVKNKWIMDIGGWCYLDANGRMATNRWVRDSVGWCYVDRDGYCVTNTWKRDSIGWCYLDANGRMATNQWVRDSVGWCYVDRDGYCVTNAWKKDSVGWCYLDASGRMKVNAWLLDGGKWYYLDGNGYMLANTSRRIGGKTYRFNASGVCTNP